MLTRYRVKACHPSIDHGQSAATNTVLLLSRRYAITPRFRWQTESTSGDTTIIRSALFVITLALFIPRCALAEPEQLPMTEIGAESRRLLQESESRTPSVFPASPDGVPQTSGS